MSDFSLPKSQRLTNKKKFDHLFSHGLQVKGFPLTLIYILEPKTQNEPPYQFAFTVPKRKFSKAVDRNYIKRRIKEAFRLNKSKLVEKINLEEQVIYGTFIYIGNEKMSFADIEKGMLKVIRKFNSQ